MACNGAGNVCPFMARAVGIDFGTTNSVIAVLEGGEPVIIPNADGGRITPSVVAFTAADEILVGNPAKNQAVLHHETTLASVKRKLGTDFRAEFFGKEYSAEDLAAFIIERLRHDAEAYFDEPVQDAIITVPAYFNDAQRKAVKNAGEAAGFNVMRLINEPTAAALAYGLPRNHEGMILVFDLGGGTFDVSILDISGTVYEVAATRGNNMLGGDDFDAALMRYICDDFLARHGVDLRQDRMALQKVRETAEQAKIELSTATSANVAVPFLSADENGPLHLEMDISRAAFELLIRDELDVIGAIVDECIQDAGIIAGDIDAVVLVGGSSRIPAMQSLLCERFGDDKILKSVNPDESVAAGACIQAGIMTGNVAGLVLVDVASLSLGIETENDVFVPVIERNSCIPTTCARTFTTVSDNQTSVEVHVLQGERPQASKNFSLGRFHLEGIRAARRGEPRIEVLFDIDANGLVHVRARDSDTGACEEIDITPDKKIPESELDRILREAAACREEDELFIKRTTLIKQANRLLDRLKTQIRARGPQARPDPELAEILAFIEQALQRENLEQIKDAVAVMNQYLNASEVAQ